MLKKLKSLIVGALNKKTRGVSSLIASMIAIVAISALSICALDTSIEMGVKGEIDQAMRAYIILVETKSVVKVADVAELKTKVENINLVKPGSVEVTCSPAVGQAANLFLDAVSVTVTGEVAVSGIKDGSFAEREVTYVPFSMTRYATSKGTF